MPHQTNLRPAASPVTPEETAQPKREIVHEKCEADVYDFLTEKERHACNRATD